MVDIRVGQTTVPTLVGLDQAAAEAALLEADLGAAYATAQPSTAFEAGVVMSQDVAAGTDIDPGSTITLILSLGVEELAEGGLSSRPRRRYYVEVMGQRFEAQSPQHAQALLEQSREIRARAEKPAPKPAVRKTAPKVEPPVEVVAEPTPPPPLPPVIDRSFELALLAAQQLVRRNAEDTLLLLI